MILQQDLPKHNLAAAAMTFASPSDLAALPEVLLNPENQWTLLLAFIHFPPSRIPTSIGHMTAILPVKVLQVQPISGKAVADTHLWASLIAEAALMIG